MLTCTCILAEEHLVYAFFFCSGHMAVQPTIGKWTGVVKKLKRSGSLLECLTRDQVIQVWASLAPLCSVRYVLFTLCLVLKSLIQEDPS